MPNVPPKVKDWVNLVATLIAIAALVFAAGRKDAQLDEVKNIVTSLVQTTLKNGEDTAGLKTEYRVLKERIDGLERRFSK